jgi:replicative DNA helicase
MQHDHEIERAALLSLLSGDLHGHLSEDDFHERKHKKIFSMAMKHSLSGSVDLSSVAGDLGGNYEWLRYLEGSPFLGPPFYLLRKLRHLRAKREAVAFRSMADGEGIPDEFAEKGREIREMLATDDDSIDQLAERIAQGIPRMPTGFLRFDNLCCGGVPRGGILVIAAQEGCGKTALSINIAYNAIASGKKACFVSLEMSAEEVGTRYLQRFWDLPAEKIRKNAKDAVEPLLRFRIITPSHDIERLCGSMSMFLDSDLFIVDYFDLIGCQSRENHTTRLEIISHQLKHFAMENQKTMIVLAQLSKDLQKSSSNREPILADIHGTSALSKDAHVVSFLWDKNSKDSSSDADDLLRNKAKENDRDLRWIIRKNRNGLQGSVAMDFAGEVMKFSECTDSTFRV